MPTTVPTTGHRLTLFRTKSVERNTESLRWEGTLPTTGHRLTLLYFFSSACTGRCRGETQTSVCSKANGQRTFGKMPATVPTTGHTTSGKMPTTRHRTKTNAHKGEVCGSGKMSTTVPTTTTQTWSFHMREQHHPLLSIHYFFLFFRRVEYNITADRQTDRNIGLKQQTKK